MSGPVITFVIFSTLFACGAAVDQTVLAGASGYDVVESVINLIRENCIFAHDKLLLRRLAYVLTADGSDPLTYRPGYYGGIWAVDNSMFQQTQTGGPILTPLYTLILHSFSIDWHRVVWQDLRKPLYSGLAAALYIKLKTSSTGVAWAVEDQAKFVSHTYATSMTANGFEQKAKLLDMGCGAPQEIDLAFVIDDSSSLGTDDFQRMISFLESVVDEFHIGITDTQVAVVEFDSHAKVQFFLNQHLTKADLKNAIRNIRYDGGSTNTAEAITLTVNEVFSVAKGSRPVAKKVVVLITDGHSNDAIDTHHAADLLHRQGIATFSIGVGNVSIPELNVIATDPDCTHVVSISHYSEIKFMKNEIQKSSCEAPLYTNKTVTCEATKCPTVGFPVPTNGLTVTTEITCGDATVYASFLSTKPGSAYYEIKQSLNPTHTSIFYVHPKATNQPIFVNVGDYHLSLPSSGTAKCMVTMTPCVGDCTKHEVHVICEDNGVYRNCTRDDLKGRCGDDWGFKNPCSLEHVTHGEMYFPYPGSTNKFILCDHAGGALIVSCPPNTEFIKTCGYCVPNNQIATLPCASMWHYNSSNPCSTYSLFMGIFDYPYAPDKTKYIHCDVWGYPWVMSCPVGQVWELGHRGCIVPVNFNPCPSGKITGERYHPYPADCHKYIECDRYFQTAWTRNCPVDEVWHDSLKTCDVNPGTIPGCV